MPIIGTGFLARHFHSITQHHPAAFILAAGVGNSACRDERAFDREIALVEDSIADCSRNDWQLVYFSSCGLAPGCYEENVREDAPVVPRTPYGRHKLALEKRIREAGIRHLILRLSNLVGEHQPPFQLIPALVAQVRQGAVQVWRGAHRDLIDVKDAVTLTDLLLRTGDTHQVFNIASGVSVEIDDIVDYLAMLLGVTIHKRYVDHPDRYCVSIQKVRSALGSLDRLGFDANYYRHVLDKYYQPGLEGAAHQQY